MQNAGQHYGEGVTPVQESPFVSTVGHNSSSNSTSSLRQFRKKENVEKASIVNGAATNQDSTNSSHVARVAPHNHYPHKQNEYFRYPPQYPEYSSPYKESTVKYSEIAEPVIQSIPHLDHLPPSVLTKHKEKEYVEMCNIPQQSHLNKAYPEHQFNGQQNYTPEMSMHHQYMHKEPQSSQMHSSYKPESQYIPKEGVFNHQIPPFLKYNIPQSRNYVPLDNSSLAPFQRMDPHLARSFMNDHHHMREFPTEYGPMEQSRMYAQKQRYYPTPLPPSNSTYPPNYPHRNIPAQQYNYPSCNYPRTAQMNSAIGRYPMNVEGNMSPRRSYPENIDMGMNFPPVPQKISTNYPNYPAYAQHYQQRRTPAVPQEYYHHQQLPHSRPHAQYIPNHHPQEMPENHVASNNIRQYLENWAEEEPSTEIPENPKYISRLGREEANEVYVINASELPQYLENGVPLIASENGQYIFKSNVSIDNTGTIKILDKSVENNILPTDAQDRVVSLHIIENPKTDCLVNNRASNVNAEHQVATNQPATSINVTATTPNNSNMNNSTHRPYNQSGYNVNRMNMVHHVSPMTQNPSQNCDTSINLSLHHNATNSSQEITNRTNCRSPEKNKTNTDNDQMKMQVLSYNEVPQNSCIVMPSSQNRLNFDESLLPNPVPCDSKQKKDFEVRNNNNDANSVISNVINEEAILKEAHEELDKIVQDTLTSTNMHIPLENCEKNQLSKIEENLNSRIPDFLNLDLDSNSKDLGTTPSTETPRDDPVENEAIIDLSTNSRRTGKIESEEQEIPSTISCSPNQTEEDEVQTEIVDEEEVASTIKHMPLIFDSSEDPEAQKSEENQTSLFENKSENEHEESNVTLSKIEDEKKKPENNNEEKTEFEIEKPKDIISGSLDTEPQPLEFLKKEQSVRTAKEVGGVREKLENEETDPQIPLLPEEIRSEEDGQSKERSQTEKDISDVNCKKEDAEIIIMNEETQTTVTEEQATEDKEEENSLSQTENSEETNTSEVDVLRFKRKRIFSVDDIIYRIGSTINQIQKNVSEHDNENEETSNTECLNENWTSQQGTEELSEPKQENEGEKIVEEIKEIEMLSNETDEEKNCLNNEDEKIRKSTIQGFNDEPAEKKINMDSSSNRNEVFQQEQSVFSQKDNQSTFSQHLEMTENSSSQIENEVSQSAHLEKSKIEATNLIPETGRNNEKISDVFNKSEDEELKKNQNIVSFDDSSLEGASYETSHQQIEKKHSIDAIGEKSDNFTVQTPQELASGEISDNLHSSESKEAVQITEEKGNGNREEEIKPSSEDSSSEKTNQTKTSEQSCSSENLDVETENRKRSLLETDMQNEYQQDEEIVERISKKLKFDDFQTKEDSRDQTTIPKNEISAKEEKPCRFSVIQRTETLHKEPIVLIEKVSESSSAEIVVQEEESFSSTFTPEKEAIIESTRNLDSRSNEETEDILLLNDELDETLKERTAEITEEKMEDSNTTLQNKHSKEDTSFEERFIDPLLKTDSFKNDRQEEKTPTETVQYRSVLKIEENAVLLEICGELVEICVNQINGRKVITVLPMSTTATVDINDNYEQAERVHHEDITISNSQIESEMPELHEETSEHLSEESGEKKLPVLVKMINSSEDEENILRNEEITSTQTETVDSIHNNDDEIFEDIILNENEIIIGDESLEEEINLDLKGDSVVLEEKPMFCTKAAKKIYDDVSVPVPLKTHSTLRDFRKLKTKPESQPAVKKENDDEMKGSKYSKGSKRTSTRQKNVSELKEESQEALLELIKQRKIRKEKMRLKYSQYEVKDPEVSDKASLECDKIRQEKEVKSEIRKVHKMQTDVMKVEKNQVSSIVHKVRNNSEMKRKENSDIKTKCKDKIRRKSVEETKEKFQLIASVIIKEPCFNLDSEKQKLEEKPTSTCHIDSNHSTLPEDFSVQNFQDGHSSKITDVTKYLSIQEKHSKFPKISAPRDLSLTKNINEHYLSRKDHSNLKKKLSIQEYNSRKRKMEEAKVATHDKVVKKMRMEEPRKMQSVEENHVRPSTIYSGRQFENISNCVKDPRRLQFINSGHSGMLRANSEDSSSSKMSNISPLRSLSTETISTQSSIIIDSPLNKTSTNNQLKNYTISTPEKLLIEVNESRIIDATNRRLSTETSDKKDQKIRRKVSFDDNVQINEIHTTQTKAIRMKQDSNPSCCEVTSSCSDNFDEKSYPLCADKIEKTGQENQDNLIKKFQSAIMIQNDWEDSNSPKDCITDAFADSFLDKTKLETLKTTTKSKLIIDINDFDTSELKNSYKNNSVSCEDGLKNYKEEVDLKLNSLNIQIPKTTKNRVFNEDDLLMHKFLRKEQLSSEEIKQIRRIIYYKKKIQQLTQQNSNSNIRMAEENYEIKKSPESSSTKELKLQFKKVGGIVKKKKKRFRNLYSNSPDTSENELQETAGEFSVYEGENISGVKLIFKRKTDYLNLQPVVKIQRCKYIDSMAKNLKYE
ncbi:uncharacterized protein LOC123676671 isoform X2 [Harmonia axyridis]|uniref:uncharacterized protein LOC123676671 isoform X2 n=1 Tax=Harmonia axyridis TaxID=115357 RepID=UPI001E2777CC|nr:uncharacterized protein LOC123676671 isoform X2 [Harmonia axyridis]